MPDSRNLFISWGLYFENKINDFVYSEGADRMSAIGVWPIKFPVHTDCSGFITWLCWLAGMEDPNGQNYDHEGYTGTLLSNNTHITVDQVLPGDIVVYGDAPGEHTALIVQVTHGSKGIDILTLSHGGPTGQSPILCWVNNPVNVARDGHPTDGRMPQTFLRLKTAQVHTPHPVPAT
jgi:hypothetical protein